MGILVSALVSSYNGAQFVKGCMEDLLAQTLFRRGLLEIIVVDSASEQNEEEIVTPYATAHDNISYLRTPERENMYAAWNRGVAMAKGEFLTNANVDDRHAPDYCEVLVDALETCSDASFAYGDSLAVLPSASTDKTPSSSRLFRNQRFFAPSMLVHHLFGYQPLWRKCLHEEIGPFNDKFVKSGDYEFALRAAAASKAVHVPKARGMVYWGDETQTLSDLRMKCEVETIKQDWLQDKKIYSLYATEGFSFESDKDKAAILHDLGNRFLFFFPQWKGGNPEIDPDRACTLYERSLNAVWNPYAKNNLAVAKFISGRFEEALSEASQRFPKTMTETCRHNHEAMYRFLSSEESVPDLLLYDSPLSAPREDELSHMAQNFVTPMEMSRVPQSEPCRLLKVSISALWDGYVGSFSPEQWADLATTTAQKGKLYIYGAGARGVVFSALCQQRKIPVSGFFDADTALSGRKRNGLPVHAPDTLPKETEVSRVVLASGRAHWPSIRNSLEAFLPREKILSPSFSRCAPQNSGSQ